MLIQVRYHRLVLEPCCLRHWSEPPPVNLLMIQLASLHQIPDTMLWRREMLNQDIT